MNLNLSNDVLSLILHATIVVKIVLGILVGMSIISWTIIFYKLFSLFKNNRELNRDIMLLKNSSDFASALKRLRENSKSTIYKISLDALNEIKKIDKSNIPPIKKIDIACNNVENIIDNHISEKLKDLSSSISFLAICTNAAPFIGLFGTVWGIIHAFHSIGIQKSVGLSTVAPGIAEALIATAFGLAVAIPASIAYNAFIALLSKIENNLLYYKKLFINRINRELNLFTSSKPTQNK